jgi:hypothetical protein
MVTLRFNFIICAGKSPSSSLIGRSTEICSILLSCRACTSSLPLLTTTSPQFTTLSSKDHRQATTATDMRGIMHRSFATSRQCNKRQTFFNVTAKHCFSLRCSCRPISTAEQVESALVRDTFEPAPVDIPPSQRLLSRHREEPNPSSAVSNCATACPAQSVRYPELHRHLAIAHLHHPDTNSYTTKSSQGRIPKRIFSKHSGDKMACYRNSHPCLSSAAYRTLLCLEQQALHSYLTMVVMAAEFY